MRAHALILKSDRALAFEEMRQEIQGKLPAGPFEFSSDNVTALVSDIASVVRFKQAIARDIKYSAAGSVFLRLHGMSNTLRSIYDGGYQIMKGGGK